MPKHTLLPVLPLRDSCLFPEASLTTLVTLPGVARAVETAERTGGLLLAVQSRDAGRDIQPVGTLARLRERLALENGTLRVEHSIATALSAAIAPELRFCRYDPLRRDYVPVSYAPDLGAKPVAALKKKPRATMLSATS